MNKDRRKEIDGLILDAKAVTDSVEELKTSTAELLNQIEAVRDEEQEYKDNMPESLQGGEKGEAADAAIEALERAIEALGEVESLDLDAVADALEEAKG